MYRMKTGPTPKVTNYQIKIAELWADYEIGTTEAARKLKVDKSAVYRLIATALRESSERKKVSLNAD